MNQPSVTYIQNGERKTISQEQAIHMLDSIAESDMQRALVHYLKLTDANPDAGVLRQRFYDNLLNMYLFDELLDLSNKRLQATPDCRIAFSSKLNALRHMFRNKEAIDMLRSAYLEHPEDYDAVTILGNFYKDEGEFDNALASFDHAITVNPNYAPPYWYRADLSHDADKDYATITKQIADGNTQDRHAHYLHFAAYKHAEKRHDYQTAFEHLSIANGLKRHTVEFDLAQEIAIDHRATEIFTAERLAQPHHQDNNINHANHGDLRPIFILGMPRSGTTLVEQIIASHSSVAGGDEYTALANAIMRVQRASTAGNPRTKDVDQWLASLKHTDFANIGRAYEHNMRHIRGDKTVFTDKNQFNHRSVGVINAALPNARIIMVDRNPMDVLFGCYRQLFGGDGAPFSYQFAELVQYYQSYNSLIDHWCENTNGLIFRVQYEELVRDPKEMTDQILNFCDLDIEQNCYDFHQTTRSVKTLSGAQVRQPIFTHGIGRWKTYESQLGSLVTEAKKAGLEIL